MSESVPISGAKTVLETALTMRTLLVTARVQNGNQPHQMPGVPILPNGCGGGGNISRN